VARKTEQSLFPYVRALEELILRLGIDNFSLARVAARLDEKADAVAKARLGDEQVLQILSGVVFPWRGAPDGSPEST
jgi:hypothetical protein